MKFMNFKENLVGKLKKNYQRVASLHWAKWRSTWRRERQARTNAENQRGGLARELDDLSERVEGAGGATMAQV